MFELGNDGGRWKQSMPRVIVPVDLVDFIVHPDYGRDDEAIWGRAGDSGACLQKP